MGKLTENTSIKKRDPKDRVYCHEPYAQALYDAYCDHAEGKAFISKDFKNNEIYKARIARVSLSTIEVELDFGQTIFLDYKKESKFFNKQGITPIPGMSISVIITDAKNSFGSAEKAFSITLKNELMQSMKDNASAYKVTVIGVNDGGFIVDLNGMNCFMPGSLAAANKINDFESMMGKEMYVMVETYLEKSDMFVVSVKKYIKHILPSKIKEIDYTKEYSGHVTGVSNYGVFVEWDEIFTGLLHETEVGDLNWTALKSGDPISFYIKEIRENNRIILSQKGPNAEVMAYVSFKEQYEGGELDGEIKDIKPFGIFIKMGEITGMMTPKEFKKYPKLTEGDIIEVHIKQVDPSAKKVYLRQPEPDLDAKMEDLRNMHRK